jgi:methyl-accepting chemotaxis protein
MLTWLLPTVLLPLVAAGGIAGQLSHQQAEEELEQNVRGRADLTSEVFDQILDTSLIHAANLSVNPLLIDAARTASQKAEVEGLPALPIAQIEARFASTKLLQPNQRLNDYLRRMKEQSGLGEVFLTERNGFNVAASNPTSDFVQRDEPWWQEGKTNDHWVSPPEFDESANQSSISLVQSMRDPSSGEFVGVLKALLPVEKIAAFISNSLAETTSLEGSQQIQVVDTAVEKVILTVAATGVTQQDTLLGGDAVLKAVNFIVEGLSAGNGIEEIEAGLNRQAPVQELKLELDRHHRLGENDPEESSFVIASFVSGDRFYSVSASDRSTIAAIASIDHTAVEAAGRNTTWTLLGLALGLGVIASAAIWWLSHRLAAPLAALAATTQQAAAGNLNVYAKPYGTREAQTLALGFNNLITQTKTLLREQAEEADLNRLMTSISEASTDSEEEVTQVLSLAVDTARELIGSERVVIYRFRPDWSGRIAAESAIPGLPSALKDRMEDPCIPEAIRNAYVSGRVLANTDVYSAGFHPDHVEMLVRLSIKSNVIVPILAGGQLFGLLIGHYCTQQHEWQSDEIDWLKEIANRLTLALNRVAYVEQAEFRAEQERFLKEQLQRRALELLMEVDPISQGDLTVRAKVTEDEIGTLADSYNSTVSSLRKIVQQVQVAAQQVASTANQNEPSVRDLSQEAVRQARDIANALDKIQSVAMAARLVAGSAGEAESAVLAAAKTVFAGDAAMNRTVDGFMAIRETVAETSKKVKRLGEASQKISKVVNLIDSFADQTNLLALNASIEAAHAGEEGRGFAVVAEEVRSLARQSAAATAEIATLVRDIQTETNEVMVAMESGTEQVVAGTQLVEETRLQLNQIAGATDRLTQLVNDIARAAVEQSSAAEIVTHTMEEVAAIADKTSTSATGVSTSFRNLLAVARELQASVGQFKVD